MDKFFNFLNYIYFNKKFIKKNKFYFKKINLVYAWSKYLLTSYSNNKKLFLRNYQNKRSLEDFKISKIKIFFFIILSRLVKLYPNKKKTKILFYINAKHINKKAKLFCNTMRIKAYSYIPIISDINKINIFDKRIWVSKYQWTLDDFKSSKNFIKKISENIYNDIRLINPKVIFVFEGDSYIHNIIGNCAKKTKTKIIIIQNGYNIYKKLPAFGWRNMAANYYLSWSKHNSAKLKKFNPDIKFFTVGNFLQYQKFDKKKINIHNYVSFILAREENDKFLDFIKNFANSNNKMNIIVRLHPNSKMKLNSSFMNLKNITIHKNEHLNKTLMLSRIVISKMSSVLIESMNYDAVGICFNINYKDLIFDNLKSAKMMLCCKTYNELNKKLNSLMKDDFQFNKYLKNIKKKRSKYIASFNNNSIKTIKNLINK